MNQDASMPVDNSVQGEINPPRTEPPCSVERSVEHQGEHLGEHLLQADTGSSFPAHDALNEAAMEQFFMQSGQWLMEEVERRLAKPMDQVVRADLDDDAPAFDRPFLEQIIANMKKLGVCETEIALSEKLALILPMAFSVWFTEG